MDKPCYYRSRYKPATQKCNDKCSFRGLYNWESCPAGKKAHEKYLKYIKSLEKAKLAKARAIRKELWIHLCHSKFYKFRLGENRTAEKSRLTRIVKKHL